MYQEKLIPLLEDLENKEVEIAGGSVVGMNLAITNSLIIYIANLTIGKKKYENVHEEVKDILEKAKVLKKEALNAIDKDKEILEKILAAYKKRNENAEEYEKICKEATNFCMDVVELAKETLELSKRISKVGNRMLSSDFEICKNYANASIKSAIVNVNINLDAVKDENFKNDIQNKCQELLNYMKG